MGKEAEEMVAGCNVRRTGPPRAGSEEGGMGPLAKERRPGKLEKARNGFSAGASRREHSPADILVLAQGDSGGLLTYSPVR